MKTRLFLFDLDGTLVSTGGAGTRALAKAFLTLHNIPDADRQLDLSGKTDHAIFREIMMTARKEHLSTNDLLRVSELYLQHLEAEMKTAKVRVLNGVMDFVKKAARHTGILSGLGTGNLERGARLKLGPTGLNSYFKFGGYGSDAEDRAEMLRFGRRRAEDVAGEKLADAQVLVIGDTPLDVLAARRCGFRVAAVATGRYSYEQLEATHPDFLFHDLSEADALIESETRAPAERT
jgi:phosphoglycolate phosphatase-like HAD superfamily hydrolase